MTEPYLILHKVRGEPAFDIATKIMIGSEEGWIIPTSGHRAYPYWCLQLGRITQVSNIQQPDIIYLAGRTPIPDNHPDHYDAKRDDGSHLVNAARDILLRKGRIAAAQPTFRRA